jgi:hypothetical protein
MPLRPATPAPTPPPPPEAAHRRSTTLTADEATDPPFRFLTSLIEPTLTEEDDDPDTEALTIRTADGSHARRHPDGTVTETGPRRLWAALEAAHRAFTEAGRPDLTRFGLTVTGPGARDQRLWLDAPDGPSWPLHVPVAEP